MQTYNATVRLGGKLDNEVAKKALTTPEVMILQKIHGKDSVVKIEPAGHWDEHYHTQTIKDDNNQDEEILVEYDDAIERDRLARLYGVALSNPEESPADAIGRLFGEFSAMPTELAEFKNKNKLAKDMAKAAPSANLKKVS